MTLVHRPLALLARLIPLSALTGCATRASTLEHLNGAPSQEYRGYYLAGQGASWFQPCGAPAVADSAWWVTLTGAAVAQVDSARRAVALADGQRTFVRWRGVVTRSGVVGPPGRTALLVREVLVMRPGAVVDCATP